MRRTFASLVYAIGEPPPVVMAELGHTDPKLALKGYAQVMRRDQDETAALKRLVGGKLGSAGKPGAKRQQWAAARPMERRRARRRPMATIRKVPNSRAFCEWSHPG